MAGPDSTSLENAPSIQHLGKRRDIAPSELDLVKLQAGTLTTYRHSTQLLTICGRLGYAVKTLLKEC
jgi:hypothetical protein